MKKQETLIDKSDIMDCWACDGTGKVNNKTCKACDGTGKWREPHYIVIDTKNNIAIDTDNGG
jgi:DnaJ-class molecular chaperone